eukprot:9073538-Prorocentrum_lima.AAC.1
MIGSTGSDQIAPLVGSSAFLWPGLVTATALRKLVDSSLPVELCLVASATYIAAYGQHHGP